VAVASSGMMYDVHTNFHENPSTCSEGITRRMNPLGLPRGAQIDTPFPALKRKYLSS